jgi:uncharacterized protein YneF (UPF0154 family)
MTDGIEVITVIEGIIIMLFGAGIYVALPMLITGLLGAVFLIVGVVVVKKGVFKKFRNPYTNSTSFSALVRQTGNGPCNTFILLPA